jgi:hypothetical protein
MNRRQSKRQLRCEVERQERQIRALGRLVQMLIERLEVAHENDRAQLDAVEVTR